jgi:hypothetical protein
MRSPLTPLLALLVACGTDQAVAPDSPDIPPPSFRATAVTQSANIPLDESIFTPCANGGAGEEIVLSGNLHLLFHATQTEHSLIFTLHQNLQGVTGTGVVTGTTYHATGISLVHFTVSKGVRQTVVDNFNVIGPAGAGSLLLHEVFHFTVNANGEVAVELDHVTMECR